MTKGIRNACNGRATEVALARQGVVDRIDQLAVALQWMLECHARARQAMPKGSQSRAMLDGAFGKLPELAGSLVGVKIDDL